MHNHENKVFMLNNKRGLWLKLVALLKEKSKIYGREQNETIVER